MSTKIYDGFVFVPKNITTINKNIQEFRHKVDRYVSRMYQLDVANVASYFFDRICCGLEKNEKNESPFFHAVNVLSNEVRLIKTSMERNMFDYGCSITIHPYKKRFYGILFCNDKRIHNMWFSQSFLKEYRYWDNTDPLETISYKKWKQRGRDWDKILKEFHYIPSMNGFVAEFTRDMCCYIPLSIGKIIMYIPNYERRLEKIIYNILIVEFDQIKKENRNNGIYAYDRWIKEGNPGFERVKKLKEKFGKKMKKEISKEMLIGGK